MTPEREAQMREMFEAWAKVHANYLSLKKGNCGWYISPRAFDMFEGFLACARALEPMVRDGERYRAIRATGRDWSNLRVFDYRGALDAESLDEEADALINAAMSAALEDGNATE